MNNCVSLGRKWYKPQDSELELRGYGGSSLSTESVIAIISGDMTWYFSEHEGSCRFNRIHPGFPKK